MGGFWGLYEKFRLKNYICIISTSRFLYKIAYKKREIEQKYEKSGLRKIFWCKRKNGWYRYCFTIEIWRGFSWKVFLYAEKMLLYWFVCGLQLSKTVYLFLDGFFKYYSWLTSIGKNSNSLASYSILYIRLISTRWFYLQSY